MQHLVVWSLDTQRYALPFEIVERVVRVVAITPLPNAPGIICGIVNVQGKPVPVIDSRARFGLPAKRIQLSDQLVIANTRRRSVALLVDRVEGLVAHANEETVAAEMIVPGMGCIAGVAKFQD